MAVGIRLLLTAMSAIGVALCVGTLWAAVSWMAVDGLSDAREDQLASSSKQTARQVLAYFQQASIMGTAAGTMWNSSLYNSPGAPELRIVDDYANTVNIMLRSRPAIESIFFFRPRERAVVATMAPEDQVCDLDGTIFSSALTSVLTIDTVGNPPNCTPGLLTTCQSGGYAIVINGVSIGDIVNPGRPRFPYTTVPCTVAGNTEVAWTEGLPGDMAQWDSGIRQKTWGERMWVTGANGVQTFSRKLHFPIEGTDWAPNSGLGIINQRVSASTLSEFLAGDSVYDILQRAANASEYSDVIFLLSPYQELISTSLTSFNAEGRDVNNSLYVLHANDPVVPEDISSISTSIFEMYCRVPPCDWSRVGGVHTWDGLTAVLEYLDDPHAVGLNTLLVSYVRRGEILAPADDLNMNIMILACCVFAAASLISLLLAHFLASPIANFANRLLSASLMIDLDEEPESKSFVSEIAVMQDALDVLIAQLLEYKSFLPAAMFDCESDTEQEALPLSNQLSCSASTRSMERRSLEKSMVSSSNNTKRKVLVAKEAVGVGTRCALGNRTVIIFCTNMRGWTQTINQSVADVSEIGEGQSTYISALLRALETKGKIDRMNGDRVSMSFGSTNACSGTTACNIGLHAMKLLEATEKGYGGGMSKGKVVVGNSGAPSMRAFNLMGPAVNIAWKLSDVASALCPDGGRELAVDAVLRKDIETEFDAFPVGVLNVEDKFPWMNDEGKKGWIYLVQKLKVATDENEEWMYQVESMQEGVGGATLYSIMDAILSSGMSKEVYDDKQVALHDLLITMKKPKITELLATSHADFCTYATHKL
ncbi:hypothetical protein DIPPA_15050 [Diplonema papillatum]|nr:hypothetical protein DIPPA_15050 [Diplonema papillatum]